MAFTLLFTTLNPINTPYRFTAANPLESVEARFQYFIKEILPKQRDTLMSHTLIYVPSYFDYVQLRNYFKKEDIGFVQICEYSKVNVFFVLICAYLKVYPDLLLLP